MANRPLLPDEVVQRLGDRGVASITSRSAGRLVEVRQWAQIELRQAADAVRVVGYASTYDQPYDIYGGPANGGFSEVIKPGAFTKSLRERDDVRLLVNHDGVPLARTRSGTMTLEADSVGLLVDAQLDPGSPLVQSLRSAMERGDLDQMSFAFQVTGQQWSPDWSERAITEVRLFDVSVVTYPANDQTMALVGADAERPAPAEPVVVPPAGIGVGLARALWHGLDGGA